MIQTKTTEMKATDQIEIAKRLGVEAFNNNAKCVPALDNEFLNMITGRGVGETPKGEASTKRLMKEWSNAWMQESANELVF